MKNAFVIALIVLLGGCAGPASQAPSKPLALATAKRSVALSGPLVVYVTASRDVQLGNDWSALMQDWQSAFAKATAKEKVAAVFVIDEASAPLSAAVLVRITVKEFSYLSSLRRSMLGGMAGNAALDVDVDYIDPLRNKSFNSQAISTSSSPAEAIFSAPTPKQVELIADSIVQEVLASAPRR